MTCESYEEQSSALIDHELKDNEQEMLFVHLGACGRVVHGGAMRMGLGISDAAGGSARGACGLSGPPAR